MSNLKNKIDFVFFVTVDNANPNGDPLNGNMPRQNIDGYGEITDVCIKRKLRNRLQDMGEEIFVQSAERSDDGAKSLSERAKNYQPLKTKDVDVYAKEACKKWMDVRSFGQVFAFKSNEKAGVSVGVRGPVSIHMGTSLSKITIDTIQITKSVNSEPSEKKSSDTMGTKHKIRFATYLVKGSINCQLAEKTGFTDEDAEKIKKALLTLFENDGSAARPEGSMEVKRLYWWKHNCPTGQYSSAKVHHSVTYKERVREPKKFEDYEITLHPLEGLVPEVFEN